MILFKRKKTPSGLLISIVIWLLVCMFLLVNISYSQSQVQDTNTQSFLKYVDPLIGTTRAGNTYPSVGVPFGMTQWTPQTLPPAHKGEPPYRFYDSNIQGFRGSHWLSGSATQDYGSFTIMPMTGSLRVYPQDRSSSFSHQDELAKPNYYQVELEDYDILAELTGTSRAGMMQFHFPKSDSAYIIIDTNAAYEATTKQTKGDGYVKVNSEKREISGYNPVYRMYQGWGEPAGFSGYFVVKFNKSFEEYGVWNQGTSPQKGVSEGIDQPGAYIGFGTNDSEIVKIKIGTSFTSIEEARNNLTHEVPSWSFQDLRDSSRKAWDNELNKVSIKGGTLEQRKNFYTSLYHSSILPRTFSDVSGTFPGFADDSSTYKAKDYIQYADFSLWDTFRALHPLLTLLEPDRSSDMIKSLISKGQQGGYLPIFPVWNNYTSEMIGDHAISVIVDAYMKGIDDFDIEKAYHLMKKNATTLPDNHAEYVDGKGRRALDIYDKLGYIPVEEPVQEAFHSAEQVSRTLEYAYDDWALAQMANALDEEKDYKKLIERASNYKNVFDSSVGYVRGRHKDGSWVEPFDSLDTHDYITEGTPSQYTWYVPHDVEGLIQLMGGRDTFISRLDTAFNSANQLYPSFRTNPYYWHGNEPSHQIAYLYSYAGAPWKTQKWVREIMRRSYRANPGGLSGNDDAGQMSAWYVFSAMGFYPVSPGNGIYILGSPIFDQVTISLNNGKKFTIETINNSRKNKYVQSAELNSQDWEKPWITHHDITKGGKLKLRMGPEPNKSWGSSMSNAPPSMTKVKNK